MTPVARLQSLLREREFGCSGMRVQCRRVQHAEAGECIALACLMQPGMRGARCPSSRHCILAAAAGLPSQPPQRTQTAPSLAPSFTPAVRDASAGQAECPPLIGGRAPHLTDRGLHA